MLIQEMLLCLYLIIMIFYYKLEKMEFKFMEEDDKIYINFYFYYIKYYI